MKGIFDEPCSTKGGGVGGKNWKETHTIIHTLCMALTYF